MKLFKFIISIVETEVKNVGRNVYSQYVYSSGSLHFKYLIQLKYTRQKYIIVSNSYR